MKRSWMIYPAAVVICLVSGCVTRVDEKMHAVRQQAQTANAAFGVACDNFAKGADHVAQKSLADKQADVDSLWDRFVASKTQNGVITMSVADYKESIRRRDAAREALTTEAAKWNGYRDTFVKAMTDFQAMQSAIWAEEQDVMQAKQTTQAALQSGLQAIGVLGAGFMGALAF
jgi:hypothetical protein